MKSQPLRDEELTSLLKSWPVNLESDPALARKVWARIESEPTPALRLWIENLARLLAQPAMAAAALATFAALGALTAELQHSGRREAGLTRLAAEYARSIDPVQMTGHAGAQQQP